MGTFAPARHDLEALLARRQGDLRAEPYRLLLLAIATQGKSGVLTLTRGPLEKDVIFDSGAAIDCQSNIATESLARFLVASGRISEGQSPDVLPAAERNRAIQQSLGRKLLEPFSWTSGTWEFSPDAPPVEAAHRVRVPQLIVTGIVKVEPFETIEAALHDAGAMRVTIGDASELRLSEEQQRTLAALREGATLEQFAGNEDLQRFIYALLLIGIARPASQPTVPFFELDIPPKNRGAPASSRPPRRLPAGRSSRRQTRSSPHTQTTVRKTPSSFSPSTPPPGRSRSTAPSSARRSASSPRATKSGSATKPRSCSSPRPAPTPSSPIRCGGRP